LDMLDIRVEPFASGISDHARWQRLKIRLKPGQGTVRSARHRGNVGERFPWVVFRCGMNLSV
jgi:hypothetical protein